jgi:hypothetical protein
MMGIVKRGASATRVSRDVEVRDVADLALAPPRAALAVSIDGTVYLLPAAVTLADRSDPGSSTRLIGVPEDAPDLAGRDVVLVVDDGPQWFRLRALIIRGTAIPAGNRCYRVEPRRVVAWDYGSLQEVPAGEAPSPPPKSRAAPSAEPTQPSMRSAAMAAALRASRVMVLATRSAKGTVFAVPLWFVVHRGTIYATTSASSWTVRNVDACHRSPCCWAVNVVPARTDYWYGVVPRLCSAGRRRSCSPGARCATTSPQGSPPQSCDISTYGDGGRATTPRGGRRI